MIDAAGDKAPTERNVFEAAEETLRELVHLVKKWTNANATNILLTADHGFLYQDIPLEQSYYVSEAPQGDAVTKTNRRYVLGRALKPSPSLHDVHLGPGSASSATSTSRSRSRSTASRSRALAPATSTVARRSRRSSSR